MVARMLGRTHTELIYGDDSHAPISSKELTWQFALLNVEAEEREEQMED